MAGKCVEDNLVPSRVVHTHYTELIIGAWKTLFEAEQLKLLIAESINEWTHLYPRELVLIGYLITEYSVYLIVETEKDDQQLLISFDEIVISAIEHHHPVRFNLEAQEHINSKLLYRSPFLKRDFYSENLIRLLTGKECCSLYQDPKLEQLKANLKHYKYCSALDYAGGKGPVTLHLPKQD